MSERREMFTDYKDVVTPTELQQMLGIGRTKAYSLLQSGAIQSKKVGTKYKISKINVIEFLEED